MQSVQPTNKYIQELPRTHYPVKILQFGSGNFLRGFADWMIQEANHNVGFNAGVSVVQSVSTNNTLQLQDGVYTVILKGIHDDEFVNRQYKVDVIQRVVNPNLDFNAFLEEAANPDLQFIISNTTEAGIEFSEKDKHVDTVASTFPGKLTQLLYARFKHDLNNGIIVLPTELIEQNGAVLKTMVQKYATHWVLPRQFSNWLNTYVTFCNTLVDRIVAGFPKKSKEIVFDELGYVDNLVVEGEWFHLWVIEGPRWIEEVLPFKKANFNVIITNDLTPYRVRKVRILNGGHTAMALVGTIAGLSTVRDAIDNPIVGKFIRRLIYDEIVPQIPGDLNELEKYADEVINRFRNPAIDHKLQSITLNSFSKFKVRLLPSLLDNLNKSGKIPERLSFALAALLFFYKAQKGKKDFSIQDGEDVLSFLDSAWGNEELSPTQITDLCLTVLTNQQLWNQDLSKYPSLIEETSTHLSTMLKQGIIKSIQLLETNH